MPRLDRIILGPNSVPTGDQWNRLQENIERALDVLNSQITETLNIITGGTSGGSGGTTPSGVGPRTFTWATQAIGTTSGAEFVIKQWQIPTGTPGAKMIIALAGDFRSSVGTSYFKVRLGGAKNTVSGTPILTITQPATGTGFSPHVTIATTLSPGGLKYIKITGQASANDNAAQIDVTGSLYVNGAA